MIDLKAAPYATFLLRVSTGILFLAHGFLKVFVFTIPGTVAFFESLGLPGSLAYAVIPAELLGGTALTLGIAVRPVSLALVPLLLGAVWAHSGNGWFFSNQGGGWEFPLFWAIAQMSVGLIGPGAYSVRLPKPHGHALHA